jgi:hypothetical protein
MDVKNLNRPTLKWLVEKAIIGSPIQFKLVDDSIFSIEKINSYHGKLTVGENISILNYWNGGARDNHTDYQNGTREFNFKISNTHPLKFTRKIKLHKIQCNTDLAIILFLLGGIVKNLETLEVYDFEQFKHIPRALNFYEEHDVWEVTFE